MQASTVSAAPGLHAAAPAIHAVSLHVAASTPSAAPSAAPAAITARAPAPSLPLASPKETSASLQAPRHGARGFSFGPSRLSEALDWPVSVGVLGGGPVLVGAQGQGGGEGPVSTGGHGARVSAHIMAWADLHKGASLGPTYGHQSSFHMSTGLGLPMTLGMGLGLGMGVEGGMYASSPRAPVRSGPRTTGVSTGFLPSALPMYSPRGAPPIALHSHVPPATMGPPLPVPLPLTSPMAARARRMRLPAMPRGQAASSMPSFHFGVSEEEGEGCGGLRSPQALHASHAARGAAGHMAYMPAGTSLGSSGGSMGARGGHLLQCSPTEYVGTGLAGGTRTAGQLLQEEEEEASSEGRADSFASTVSSGLPPASRQVGSKRGREEGGGGGGSSLVTPPRPSPARQGKGSGGEGVGRTPATAAAAGALSVLKQQGGDAGEVQASKRRRVGGGGAGAGGGDADALTMTSSSAVSPLLVGLLSGTASPRGYSRQASGRAAGKGSSPGKLHPWQLAPGVGEGAAATLAGPSAFTAHTQHSTALPSPRPRHGLPPPLPQGKKGTAAAGSSSSAGAGALRVPVQGWEAESLPRATQLAMAQARAAFPTAFHGPVEQETFLWAKYGLGDSRKAYSAADIAGLKGCLSLLEEAARSSAYAASSVHRRIGGYTISEGEEGGIDGSRQARLAAWSVRRAARNWSKEAMVRYPHRAGVVARRVREQGRFS